MRRDRRGDQGDRGRAKCSTQGGRRVRRAAHTGGASMSRKGSGSFFFFLQSLSVSLSTSLRSLFSYIPLLSGFLWFSDSSCQVVRNKVKKQPELRKSPEQVENQVEISICIPSNIELVRNRWVRKRRARQKFPGKPGNSSSATAGRSGMRFPGI